VNDGRVLRTPWLPRGCETASPRARNIRPNTRGGNRRRETRTGNEHERQRNQITRDRQQRGLDAFGHGSPEGSAVPDVPPDSVRADMVGDLVHEHAATSEVIAIKTPRPARRQPGGDETIQAGY
jgi:hypothetical protein